MRTTRLLVMLALWTLLLPSVAYAWGNGPQHGAGFGTHDWILVTGNRFAVARGTNWLDVAVAASATAEPDHLKGDQPNHAYDRWGKRYGTAQTRVAALYSRAVALIRAGDRTGASRTVGLLSHYYSDVCEPLNTDGSRNEKRMHDPFERAVDRALRSPSSHRSWAVYDGYTRVSGASSASAYTIAAAKKAHASYSTLVKNFNRRGFNSTSVAIARRCVARAANGVADLIMSVQQDAVEVTASPNVSAHQGVAAGEGFYYVFDTTRIARYNKSWVATGTTIDPLRGLDGFTKPHLGDGCEHEGKLYVVAENYPAVTNQHILVFDARTLQRLDAFPTGQTHEVSSICVAPGANGSDALWVASYQDSTRLFEYDLGDGHFRGTRPLSPVPDAGIQGVAYHDGAMYISAGAHHGVGYLYSASAEGSTTLLYTRHSTGYHEGIDFDGGTLLWLIDRGSAGSKVRYLRLPTFLATLN